MLDSNQRIQVSKTCALPLGESPSRRASPPELLCSPQGQATNLAGFGLVAHGDLPHSGTRTRVFRMPPAGSSTDLCTDVRLASDCHALWGAPAVHRQPQSSFPRPLSFSVGYRNAHIIRERPGTGRGGEIPTRVLRVPSAAGLSIFPTPRCRLPISTHIQMHFLLSHCMR